MTKFTIILVIYDPLDKFSRQNALPSAIKSINRLAGNYEIIFVNNNNINACPKTTNFLRITAKSIKNAKLIELEKNIGCGAGFNRGVAHADNDSDVLIFMSCDALIVDPNALLKISDVMNKFPKICATHPMSIHEDMNECNISNKYSINSFKNVIDDLIFPIENEQLYISKTEGKDLLLLINENNRKPEYPVMTLPLTFWAVRHNVFISLNGFNERFIAGYENIDFALRALEKGYNSAIMNNTVVYHRRLLFYILGQSGENQMLLKGSVEAGHKIWREIWQYPPRDIYFSIRYGKLLSNNIINPFIKFVTNLRSWL